MKEQFDNERDLTAEDALTIMNTVYANYVSEILNGSLEDLEDKPDIEGFPFYFVETVKQIVKIEDLEELTDKNRVDLFKKCVRYLEDMYLTVAEMTSSPHNRHKLPRYYRNPTFMLSYKCKDGAPHFKDFISSMTKDFNHRTIHPMLVTKRVM